MKLNSSGEYNITNIDLYNVRVDDLNDSIYIDDITKNVGIGKNPSNERLDLSGNINISGNLKIGNNTVLNNTTLGSGIINSSLKTVGTLTSLSMDGDLNMKSNDIKFAGAGGNTRIEGNSGNAGRLSFFNASNVETFRINSATNMNMFTPLEIKSGTDQNLSLNKTSGDWNYLSFGNATLGDGSGSNGLQVGLNISSNALIKMNNSKNIIFNQNNLNKIEINSTDIKINSDVDFENNNLLDIASLTATNLTGTLQTAAQGNITSVGVLSSLTVTGDLTVDTDTLYLNSATNMIGVGTLSPTNKVHIREDNANNQVYQLLLQNRSGGNGSGSGIQFSNWSGSIITGEILSKRMTTGSQEHILEMNTYTTSGLSTSLFVLRNDKVGLGINNPLYKLDVVGDINTSTEYKISGTQVLSATTLGSGVVNSSIQNLGVLNTNLDLGTNNITNATSITATNLTGTLQTAAQGNVTSLGTLTSLTMGGNLDLGTNNITNATSITATNLTGTLQTAAQPNITSLGTLSTDLNISKSGNSILTVQSTNDNAVLIIDSNTGGTGTGLNRESRVLFKEVGVNKAIIGYDPDLGGFGVGMGADTSLQPTEFFISDGGNIGVGLDTPNYKMAVNTGAGAGYIQVCNTATGSGIGDGLIIGLDASNNGIIRNKENTELKFYTSDTQRMKITSGGNVDITSAGGFLPPRISTAQRDGLTAENGMIVYNTTLSRFDFYENGVWRTF